MTNNLNKHIILGLLIAIACSWDTLAQQQFQTVELTSLEAAQKMAQKNNPDLKSYNLDLEKSRLDVKVARSSLLPSITGNFSGQKNLELATTPLPGEIFGQPGTTINAQFGREYTYNAGLSLTKSLLDWQAALKVKMARLNVETAEVQQESYLQLLDQQVTLNYYSALIAKRAIALAGKDKDLADSIVFLSRKKFDEGLLDALAVNQAKINATVVNQNLNNSEQLYAQSIGELKLLTGLDEQDSVKLTAQIQYNLPSAYVVEDLAPDKEIRLAELNAQQAENQVRLQKSMFVPRLTFNGYFGKQQFRDDFGLEFSDNSWSSYSYLGLNLSVPVFTGLSNYNKFRSSRVDFQRAENDLKAASAESQVTDSQLIRKYHTNLRNAQLALEAFRLYEENEQLTFQKYREGLLSLDRYLNAFEDYLKAENAFLNTLLDTYAYYSQIIPRLQ